MSTLIQNALLALAVNPRVMVSALSAYRDQHHLDEGALAACLEAPPERVPRLMLCQRPDPASSSFREEVARIAAYAGCSAEGLARVLREVAGTAPATVPGAG